VRELIPVRPVVHYMMGGVHTDIHGATPLAGLYAAGEVACVSINGANRLGSNSLPELLVFGARAGRHAAEYASGKPAPNSAVIAQAIEEKRRLKQFLGSTDGGERISTLRGEMQAAMEESAGIFRTGEALAKGAEKIAGLKERFRNVALDDHSLTFNTEWIAALELGFMLDVAETMVHSALARQESRGAHQRTDFPKRDDAKYLSHSLAHAPTASGGAPRIEYLPVVITRWPPGERVYGQQAAEAKG